VALLDADFSLCLAPPATPHEWDARLLDAGRALVAGARDHADVAVNGATYRVRVAALRAPEPLRYALFVEQRGMRRPLLGAYDRYGLSAREVEVLALILDGASNREIATTLCIVAGTVQDHIRSLCSKSGAKHRGELLARVFGVEEPE
jgi:DNA-binding CsgD family transcriptional regulator